MISTLRLCITACIIGTIEEVRNDRKRAGNNNARYARKRLVNRSDQPQGGMYVRTLSE